MKRLAAALLAASALFAASDAYALQKMCRAYGVAAARGPAQITTNTSPVVTYNIDSFGCVMANQADVGWLSGQGFGPSGAGGSLAIGPVSGTTTIVSPSAILPPRSLIRSIIWENVGGGSVVAKLGTTAGGTDVVSSVSATTNTVRWSPDTGDAGGTLTTTTSGYWVINKRAFPNGATLYLDTTSATGWGQAVITVTVIYDNF